MIDTMKKSILFFFLSVGVWARPIDPEKIAKENEEYIKSFQLPEQKIEVQYPSISFKTSLPVATTTKIRTIKLKNKTHFPDGTKFVFFGIDEVSKEFFKKKKNFNYGYCINFKNLKEIKDFKEQLSLSFPIGILMDDSVLKEVFGITSYPSVVEVQGNVLIIKEGL